MTCEESFSQISGDLKDSPRKRKRLVDPMRSPHPQSGLRARAAALERARKDLPIWGHADEIRQGLAQKDVMLIVGETGSGKSTQVPQILVEEGWCKRQRQATAVAAASAAAAAASVNGRRNYNDADQDTRQHKQPPHVGGCIAVTEPRKVAAIALAERVATEMATPLGSSSPASKVGFSVRFNQSVSPSTRIKFLTEGMLLQEMLRDPWLRNYSAVVLDEVHERGINVDLLLGFMRQMVTGKKEGRGGVPLKVVIMSATAETDHLREFFEDGYRQMRYSKEEEEKPLVSCATTLDQSSKIHEMRDSSSSNNNDNKTNEEIDPETLEEPEWSGFSSADEEEEEQAITPQSNLHHPLDYDFGQPLDRRKTESMIAERSKPRPTKTSSTTPPLKSHPNQDPPPPPSSPKPSSSSSSQHISTIRVAGRQYPVS
ncbi:MAG: hypothetical protein Q9191_008368, partial [Dirinaria sp. TL-2023a]